MIRKLNEIVALYIPRLPTVAFFMTFSQLVSRICHPSDDVFCHLQTILVKLIQEFQQQSLWMILNSCKSSNKSFQERCEAVLSDRRLATSSTQKLIEDFKKLADHLIELPNCRLVKSLKNFLAHKVHSKLPDFLSSPGLSQILMPTQKFTQSVTTFDANTAVFIRGMRDEVAVLSSMMKPMKITLCGSDGNDYTILLKKNDDLRKDKRIMEFHSIINHYLHLNGETRKRHLNIRTYGVFPLNESHGIIEWLPNLQRLGNAIDNIVSQKKLPEITTAKLNKLASLKNEAKVTYFKTLCKEHPPVLSDWFRKQFPTPYTWYEARTAYVRTTAVMSIVGYIIGLGDRHCENILLDVDHGDVVHVDYDCIFNKGEEAKVPEVVPMRLTQNMVKNLKVFIFYFTANFLRNIQ